MKSKSVLLKQQRNIYELKKTHSKDYSHLLLIGYQDKTATARLKHDIGRANLTRLKDRVILAQNSFGVTGVSLDGIKDTSEVKEYIHHLEQSGIATKGAGSLHLTHPKIYRRY